VLKRLDARYTPGVRTADWRKVKTAAWRTNHGPRRLPKEIRERIAAAQLSAMNAPARIGHLAYRRRANIVRDRGPNGA